MEVDAAMRTWIEHGNQVLFLTLTLPHGVGDSCGELMETIKSGWAATFTGRPWRRTRDEHRIRWWFRSWDATHGVNGWHPHVHAALFVEGEIDGPAIERLRDELYERWARAVELRGHKRPTRERGLHLEAARSATNLSRYLLKVAGDGSGTPLALELTRGDLKVGAGRTPFQILAGFRETGDLQDLRLFQEWEKATKGQHFARWNNGARVALRIVSRSDDEIVSESVGGETLHAFTPEEWIATCRTRGGQARVLEAAEEGGAETVRDLLKRFVVEWKRKRAEAESGYAVKNLITWHQASSLL